MTLLRAAFFLGQSHSEIAEATGLPLGTVKSRIRLAFGKLRKVLEQEDRLMQSHSVTLEHRLKRSHHPLRRDAL